MTEQFEQKEHYTYEDLVKLMALLRSENGCPWDREQTHGSIRKNLIEETYEVAEAIDLGSDAMLREELGDLLLQVVFHAQMAKEAGAFDEGDVADGICKKLILRHPHLFGDAKAATVDRVLSNWEDIKKIEKGYRSQTQVLQSVPKVLPALMRGQKLLQKAAKIGFDWPDSSFAMDKLEEKTAELKAAIAQGDEARMGEELGDLLLAAANVARFAGLDSEEVLGRSCEKFISGFEKMEEIASDEGKTLKNLRFFEFDILWKQAKRCIMGQTKGLKK